MTKQELRQALLGILLLATLAEAVWLYEIIVKLGWASLAWLKKDLFSPYAICLCAATAYLLPFIVKYRQIDGKVILTWLSFFLLNISVFYIGESVLRHLFSPLIALLSFGDSLLMRFFGLFAACVFAFGYFFITQKLIMKVHKQQVALFFLSIFLMFVLGSITVFVIPGFGRGESIVDAIKMGYPQFWICILLGLSGILTITYFSNEKEDSIEHEKEPLY